MTEWTTAGAGAGVPCGTPPCAPAAAEVQRCEDAVLAARADIISSAFFARLRSQLVETKVPGGVGASEPPLPLLAATRRLVVLGLGSLQQPGGVHIRYQAALAQLLQALLPRLDSPPEAFDPVFARLDAAVLPALGFSVVESDAAWQRTAPHPTLFFMPHCEVELTEALLEANAVAGTLHNVAILGNSMRQYCERWGLPRRGDAGRQRPDTMLRLCSAGVVIEAAVPECAFPVTSAFNDMGLHTFAGDWEQRWRGEKS